MIKEMILIAGLSFSMTLSPVDIPVYEAAVEQNEAEIVSVAEEPEYSEEDLYWLSRLIFAEAGSDKCSDELQLAVGSVVLNRRDSELYPDTIKEVIFDKHWGVQYGCTTDKHIYWTPNERAIENAKYILETGSTLPNTVMSQGSRPAWGNTYCNIQGVIFSKYRK